MMLYIIPTTTNSERNLNRLIKEKIQFIIIGQGKVVPRNGNKTEQYVKNIVSRFEKSFKHEFKTKDSPLPNNFIPSKKDCPTTELQIK